MAGRQNLSPDEIQTLQDSLKDGLAEAGYQATIELEPSEAQGRYRLCVVSRDFEKLSDGERQDVLWRTLRERWTRQDQLRITLSLALTEAEAQGTWK
jgi:hypothetical protein